MKIFLIICVLFSAWCLSFFLDCFLYGSPVPLNSSQNRDEAPPFHGATLDNVFWFLQVSDIHISVYVDPGRYEDLKLFIKQVVGTVKPAVVFVTGDITDAKGADQLSSTQESREWHIYRDILNQSQFGDMPWIDLRGNHDAFNVPWKYHREDMYRQYALSSTKHSSVAFKWSHKTNFGVYSFVGIDACPSPGLKRPYNFFGVLHDEDLTMIEDIMAETKRDNGTIILTHYPSSFITSDYKRMRNIFSHSIAHLCGHLHSGGEYFFERLAMYARHPDGHLELELSDWKFVRKFRLLAYDHDILSFTDTSLHKWPLVLITNPVSTHFALPGREPTSRIKHSTHIRILAFSLWSITDVLVSINGGSNQSATLAAKGQPLYVLPWQTSHYMHGKHSLTVFVKDSKGNEAKVSQKFSLDGSKDPLDKLPGFFLLTDHRSFARMTFFSLWLLLVTCLMTAWFGAGFQYFQNMTRYPPVFYPFLFNLLYFAVGPWYVGEVLRDVYGLIFVHGMMASGHFIPGSLTYVHGVAEILTYYLPLSLYLSYLLQPRNSKKWRHQCVLYLWMAFIALAIMYHMRGVRRIVRSYGWISLIISPGYCWTLVLGGLLVYLAIRKGKRT
ncbi:PREDICTED: transmembrane protein 62-like [Amphimedon queenslandica]|uniref:Uncharacterized protein n=1 Tax=Amphimedon queenslandica TaxID=400682 RepID=A0A1X7UX23_AMPQE|nr:PREDICTED: transmembrane protein 62-like [Amphimedon queenslandica]|eukprot:XP_019851820.1 PREDICTED: transmembrane protein 62-like [Amphimedon queenslandica]